MEKIIEKCDKCHKELPTQYFKCCLDETDVVFKFCKECFKKFIKEEEAVELLKKLFQTGAG